MGWKTCISKNILLQGNKNSLVFWIHFSVLQLDCEKVLYAQKARELSKPIEEQVYCQLKYRHKNHQKQDGFMPQKLKKEKRCPCVRESKCVYACKSLCISEACLYDLNKCIGCTLTCTPGFPCWPGGPISPAGPWKQETLVVTHSTSTWSLS